jgi:hypothetical protein
VAALLNPYPKQVREISITNGEKIDVPNSLVDDYEVRDITDEIVMPKLFKSKYNLAFRSIF